MCCGRRVAFFWLFISMVLQIFPVTSPACTGISLKGDDGTVIFGRTQEWGKFPLTPEIRSYPAKTQFRGTTPEGSNGRVWQSKYSFAGVFIADSTINTGMNEHGLAGGMFFHEGFAQYHTYDLTLANISMGPADVLTYILSMCQTLDDVRIAMDKGNARVVSVVEDALGAPYPMHAMITDPSGLAIVIEFRGGVATILNSTVGVITNNPNYEWHLTNLRNYGYLSAKPYPNTKWGDEKITPLASGSGMLGLPGDFTSPSRFVRAAAFVHTARQTTGGEDTAREVFRILDSFNLPAKQAEGTSGGKAADLPGGTQYTVLTDTKNLFIYYHTMYNRRVRKVDLNMVFKKGKRYSRRLDRDREKDRGDIEEVKLHKMEGN